MTKDKITVILGIIYCSLAVLCFIWGFMIQMHTGGIGPAFSSIGIFCLIPSLILFLVFILSSEGSTSAGVGFGLGIPGWVLGLLGPFLNWAFGYFFTSDIVAIIFNIALTFLGSILYSRRNLWRAPPPTCPDCNRPIRYIAQYNKYYCDQCKKYQDIISR